MGSSVGKQLWEVEVFVVEDGDEKVTTVSVEAESEEEAVQQAIAEISRALAFLSPFAKVVGAKGRRQ
jgi:hypothetical protein